FADKFIAEAPTDDIKKSLLFSTLESIMTVVFEVSSRTRFEQKLYHAVENDVYLNADKINEIYWEERGKYFGDAVEWLPEQAYEWAWKPHYYDAKFRFYNYPYVFGELLVLSLYNTYKEERHAFIPKFKEFLQAGGSKSPENLGKAFGIDFTAESFWEKGMAEIKRLLEELKAIL
ncbi:MAG: M3 family metallopeptidase, partial [Candidatus Kariarchaeaceae archaeon]